MKLSFLGCVRRHLPIPLVGEALLTLPKFWINIGKVYVLVSELFDMAPRGCGGVIFLSIRKVKRDAILIGYEGIEKSSSTFSRISFYHTMIH